MKSSIAAALAASVCVIAIATPAHAQQRQFSIPAGTLKAALDAYGRQSGRPIIYRSEDVRSAKSAGYNGLATPEAALEAILADSGFRSQAGTGASVAIVRSRQVSSASTALVEDAQPAEDPVEDIVVTGTNIRGAPPASPVVSRSRTDIQDSGLTDLGDYARSLTQNYSGGQNPNVAGAGNQGGQNNLNGSSTLNLRGLGADATLTLINGHRTAYDALNQGVDISAIPLSAVERVEVVADGASALYGSDAVGGVANIILRREYEGLETTARVGAATSGGAVQQQYSAVTGTRWSSGGLIGVVDYNDSTAVYADQRSFTRALHPSMTLYPKLRQTSLLAAGHQAISDTITLEFDAQFAHRKSRKVIPFTATSSAFVNGQDSRPSLTSWTVAPRLKIDLPAGWQSTLSGVYAGSDSNLDSLRYSAGIRSQGLSRYYNRTKTAEGNFEGPLFDTGGGTARLAFGGGFRSNELHVEIIQINSAGMRTVPTNFIASRDIYFGYGEASLPLVSSANSVPLLNRLILNAAVRYENYRGVGDATAPKLGLIYEPVPAITVRASWGKSFKAQTLYQEFQARGVYLIRSSSFVGGSPNRTVILLGGGNSNLKPERATTWTAGVTVRPVNGLSVEASYFDIRYKDRIANPLTNAFGALTDPLAQPYVTLSPTPAQVAAAVASGTQGIDNQTGAPFDPQSVEAIVDSSLRNVSSQHIRGIDVALDYRVQLSAADTLNLIGNVSYVQSDQQLSFGQPTRPLAGIIFRPPHWRGRAGASWQRASVKLSSYVNYIGGTLDNRFEPFVKIGSFTSLDTTVTVKSSATSGILKNFEFTLSALNVLNETPAFARTTSPIDPPYDSTNNSSLGRTVSLTIRKSW